MPVITPFHSREAGWTGREPVLKLREFRVFIVSCDGCKAIGFADCSCPPGVAQAAGHLDGCQMGDLGANVACSCCDGSGHPGVSHDAAANACPGIDGNHDGAPCPSPAGGCETFKGGRHGDAASVDGECPGGHCAKGVKGCTVCRPVTITVPPSAVPMQAMGG